MNSIEEAQIMNSFFEVVRTLIKDGGMCRVRGFCKKSNINRRNFDKEKNTRHVR